jgi:hypothetical protein
MLKYVDQRPKVEGQFSKAEDQGKKAEGREGSWKKKSKQKRGLP